MSRKTTDGQQITRQEAAWVIAGMIPFVAGMLGSIALLQIHGPIENIADEWWKFASLGVWAVGSLLSFAIITIAQRRVDGFHV